MRIRNILSNILALTWRRLRFFRVFRFRALQLAYRLFPSIGPRGEEWRFVLNYLHPLSIKGVRVLDVGASESLFIYEIAKRGYTTFGLDQRRYQEPLPKKINFLLSDITKIPLPDNSFDYVTCISVIEHIGLGLYGDKRYESGDRKAISEICRVLKPNGKLLITMPTKTFALNTTDRGYSYYGFMRLVWKYFDVAEYTERRGQICACCVKREVNNG